MLISHIEQVDQKRRTIFINGEEAFTLYKNEVYKYRLEKDAKISPEVYEEIMSVLNKRAKLKVMDYLKKADNPERELRNKLKKLRFPESCIDVAIEYVKQYGYIDDARYTENYIRLKKQSKSKQFIEFELKRKGIDASVIKECMDNVYCGDSELLAIQKQISKKCCDLSTLDRDKKNKLIASLCRKGFSYENVRKCLSIMDDYD